MTTRSGIDAYLVRYRSELTRQRVGGWLFRLRVLAEAESHLREAAAAIEREGHDSGRAELEAVRRFGDPGELACCWLADPASARRLFGGWQIDWIAASSLGGLAGLALALGAGRSLGAFVGMLFVLPLIGLAVGAGLGLAQALLLRLDGGHAAWVLSSALGLSIGLTVSTAVVEALGFAKGDLAQELAALIVIGLGTGAGIGLFQKLLAGPSPAMEPGLVLRSAGGAGLGIVTGGLVSAATLGGIRSGTGLLTIAFLAALGIGLATAALFRPASGRACSPSP
jgi:hypothetical protein